MLASCATIPTPQEANDAVLTLRAYESWAWALGIALICADLVLPVSQTAVVAALGSLGLITGGLLGYVLMLTSAWRYVHCFVGPRSLHKMESLFDQGGAWAIVLTRSLPYSVPEAMVFLAGLDSNSHAPFGAVDFKFSSALELSSTIRRYRSENQAIPARPRSRFRSLVSDGIR